MKKKWKDCGVTLDSIPNSVYAFYCDLRETIYEPSETFVNFMQTASHEIGHHFNTIDPRKATSEFPAEGYRAWMDSFRYFVDEVAAYNISSYPFRERVPLKDSGLTISSIGRYKAANLFFYMVTNEQNGNIDKALQVTLSEGDSSFREQFNNLASTCGATTGRELWRSVHEKILYDSPGFWTHLETIKSKTGRGIEINELKSVMIDKYETLLQDLVFWDSLSD